MPCKHMVAVIRYINKKRPLERRLDIYGYFDKIWTMKNYMNMAQAINIDKLQLIDIDDVIKWIISDMERENDKLGNRLGHCIKSPVEYVRGDYPIYHLGNYRDSKQKLLSRTGPKPHRRMGAGAGEGSTALNS